MRPSAPEVTSVPPSAETARQETGPPCRTAGLPIGRQVPEHGGVAVRGGDDHAAVRQARHGPGLVQGPPDPPDLPPFREAPEPRRPRPRRSGRCGRRAGRQPVPHRAALPHLEAQPRSDGLQARVRAALVPVRPTPGESGGTTAPRARIATSRRRERQGRDGRCPGRPHPGTSPGHRSRVPRSSSLTLR